MLVLFNDGHAIVSSVELVSLVNNYRKKKANEAGFAFPSKGFPKLEHPDFMKKVVEVLGKDVGNFSGIYLDAYKREQPCYMLPKREACLMAMSYSYELQATVFDLMTALEVGNNSPKVPQNFAQALRLAADQAEQLEAQAEQLALAAPKVEFVDRFVDATGLKGFREVCKLLKANEARFREFVISEKILYRLAGTLTAHQNHIDAGRFEVRTGVAETEHAYTATKFTPKGVTWIAGEWAKYQLKTSGAV